MVSNVLAACILIAAHSYAIPPSVLVGIMHVEGGRVGQEVGPNRNGTYDLGPMQINTLWTEQLSRYWGTSRSEARRVLRDDACMNVNVAAWVLRQKIDRAGSLYEGIAHYHSATPRYGTVYRRKVLSAMRSMGLLQAPQRTQTAFLSTGGK